MIKFRMHVTIRYSGNYARFFYPLWSKQDKSIVEVWQIEQPISLTFNGEKLQIIEAGKVLKEYEARIGDNTEF